MFSPFFRTHSPVPLDFEEVSALAPTKALSQRKTGDRTLSIPIPSPDQDTKSLLPMQPSREGSQQRLYQTQCLPLMVGRQATGAGDHHVRTRRHAEGAVFSHKRPFNMH